MTPVQAKVRAVHPSGHHDASDLSALIRNARARLPVAHRALLEQLDVQDLVAGDWPRQVLDLYRTIRETPPAEAQLTDALAVWLHRLRVVAYNGRLLTRALEAADLDASSAQTVIDNLAWHEYGHALSATRATHELRRNGPRLLDLLPPGLRGAIDYPGGYSRRQVFDEVIANVYPLLIARAVQLGEYGRPEFPHTAVFDAFQHVVPRPPQSP
jgi:phage tail protein X